MSNILFCDFDFASLSKISSSSFCLSFSIFLANSFFEICSFSMILFFSLIFLTISSALVFKPDFSSSSALTSSPVLFTFSSINSSLCEIFAFSSFEAFSFSTSSSLTFLCSFMSFSISVISFPSLPKSSPTFESLASSLLVSISISASSLSILSKSVCTETDEAFSSSSFSINPDLLFDILFFSMIKSCITFLFSSSLISISFLCELKASSLSFASL